MVMDYYSHYLLMCFLTPFQSATAVSQALQLTVEESARLHVPPATRTNPSYRQWLVLSGTETSGRFAVSISKCADPVPDSATTGLIRALSWDLKKRRSVLSYL